MSDQSPDDYARIIDAMRCTALAAKAGQWRDAALHIDIASALVKLWAAADKFGKLPEKR